MELLQTKPISNCFIVLGKFCASLLLMVIAIAPTFMYIFSISELGKPVGNIDYGSNIGSYLGLIFLSAAYAAIGLFTSTLSKNQIVAFILSVFIVFILYYGFDALANSFQQTSYTIQLFGIHEHYKSISRGVIDTRDLIYFFSVIIFFLFLTKHRITNE